MSIFMLMRVQLTWIFVQILFFCAPAAAQLVSGSAFLQGAYLEVGIAPCGAHGTPNSVPAVGAEGTAYHPTEVGLGFVADADMDGWNVGTPPYCGDYFLPGSPVEGYTMSIDGTDYSNSNGFGICGVEDIPGGIVHYGAGDTLEATWEGAHSDGFELSIRTWFPRYKRYFIGDVTIRNTSATVKEHIYFSRQVDPDNDQAWGGGFPTENKIVSQPGAGETDALVTATGGLGSFLGLGARHFASRVARGGFFIMGAEDPFCGNAPYELSGSVTSDDAIGVTFYFARLEPGEELTFSYAYVLDEDELEEALQATDAPAVIADGIPVEEDALTGMPALEVCEGDSVLLEVQGGENYNWEWSPASAFSSSTGVSVWFSPNGSGTYSVRSEVPCGDPIEYTFTAGVAEAGAVQLVDTTVCSGVSIALNHGSEQDGLVLQWDHALTGSTNAWNPVVNLDTSDAVIHIPVQITDGSGCEFTDEAIITVRPVPEVVAADDVYAQTGSVVTLSAFGASSYFWASDAQMTGAETQTPSHVVIDTALFTVTGSDEFGCSSNDDLIVYPLPVSQMAFPNAFSPNNDGVNDCFRINTVDPLKYIEIRIFNRWGEAVFISDDPYSCWDGTLAGKAQEMGSYVVVVRFEDDNGKKVNQAGTLTLLR